MRILEESNLGQTISALRRPPGIDASQHLYIVEVPGRGYQFVAKVVEGDNGGWILPHRLARQLRLSRFFLPLLPTSAPTLA